MHPAMPDRGISINSRPCESPGRLANSRPGKIYPGVAGAYNKAVKTLIRSARRHGLPGVRVV